VEIAASASIWLVCAALAARACSMRIDHVLASRVSASIEGAPPGLHKSGLWASGPLPIFESTVAPIGSRWGGPAALAAVAIHT